MKYLLRRTAVTTTVAGFVHCCTFASAFAGDPCAPYWDVTIGLPGIGGSSSRTILTQAIYDKDLFAGGLFVSAGGQITNNIARWDGENWHPLVASEGNVGIGLDGIVSSMLVYNGELVVGGAFEIDEVSARDIARWGGSAWHAFQPGINNLSAAVLALTTYKGDLIVGGDFLSVGGEVMNRIARWDGSAWHPLNSGGQIGVSGTVYALTVYNGDLIAGGFFLTAGGQQVNRIARWDGSAWHPLTSGGQVGVAGGSEVFALTVYNGALIAAGAFGTAGGQQVHNIARWDGSAWHPLTSGGQIGVNNQVHALTEFNGDLIVGGIFFTAGGKSINRIARWDDTAWYPLTLGGQIGDNNSAVRALTVFNGNLIVGGHFDTADGQNTNHAATFHAPFAIAPGDLDCDGIVNVADLFQLLAAWGPCNDCTPGSCPADITNPAGTGTDCTVDVFDLFLLLSNWSS